MTVDEFLAWAVEQTGRYELEDGHTIAMAPERMGHVLAKTSSFNALGAAVAAGKLPCRALPDGAAVRINAATLYEPDAMVFCGDAPPRDDLAIVAPIIVVEVLSPSTGRRDSHEKLVGYFTVPSIQHYLIVDADRRVLVHHAAGAKRSPRESFTAVPCASTLRGWTSGLRTCSASRTRRSAPGYTGARSP